MTDRLPGLLIVKKWLQVMQDAGWLDYIRHFAFVCQPSDMTSHSLFISFKPQEKRPEEHCVNGTVHKNVQCLFDQTPSCHALASSWDLSNGEGKDFKSLVGDLDGVEAVLELSRVLTANVSRLRNCGCSRPAAVRSERPKKSSTA